MRILVCICIGMVHAMHDSIYTGTYIRRTLAYISQYIKEPLPEFTHTESAVRSITMLQESLCKNGQVPMSQKEGKNYKHLNTIMIKNYDVGKQDNLSCLINQFYFVIFPGKPLYE